jgi:hypothetical protein
VVIRTDWPTVTSNGAEVLAISGITLLIFRSDGWFELR